MSMMTMINDNGIDNDETDDEDHDDNDDDDDDDDSDGTERPPDEVCRVHIYRP